MKKRLSDINTCDLESYPTNTKKEYSGLVGNWILSTEISYTQKSILYDWEFGWKQKIISSLITYQKEYYPKYKNKIKIDRVYPIFDYNSCFIIFNIKLFKVKNVTTNCYLILNSTDDGEFLCHFNEKYIEKIKKFFIKNYKKINLDSLYDFLTEECEGIINYYERFR